jgi:ketosteroid isomerase-like protein
LDPTGRYLSSDEDVDRDDNGDPRHYLRRSRQDSFIPYGEGSEASRSDRLAIASLVRRYYVAAAAEDGARACAMLSPDIVAGLSEEPASSSAPTRQNACAMSMSRVLKAQHQLLMEDDVPTMVVIDVRVDRDVATATLGFRRMPVGSVRLRGEKGVWKMDSMLDERMLS